MGKSNPEDARIGLFFTPFLDGRFEILEKSASFVDVETIGGFKTHPDGHVDVWRELSCTRRELRGYPYEYFPRGRVNWREDDGTFLFLADKTVFEENLHLVVCRSWGIVGFSVSFLLDLHYQSPSFQRTVPAFARTGPTPND